MRSSSPAAALAVLLLATSLLGLPTAAAANERAESVLEALGFSAAERRQIVAGELVTTASRAQTSDRELAISMAFLIRNPPADLVDQFTRATAYETDTQARAYGPITGQRTAAELQGLRLGDAEARRFADARPGTDLNLSAAESAALRALPDKGTAAVEAAVRDLLLDRYRAYRARGLAGIAAYDRGGGKQSDPAAALRGATTASPVLQREAPEMVKALLEYPGGQPADAREAFLWVNFDIDQRPTLSLTHRLASRQSDGTFVLADRHYYVQPQPRRGADRRRAVPGRRGHVGPLRQPHLHRSGRRLRRRRQAGDRPAHHERPTRQALRAVPQPMNRQDAKSRTREPWRLGG